METLPGLPRAPGAAAEPFASWDAQGSIPWVPAPGPAPTPAPSPLGSPCWGAGGAQGAGTGCWQRPRPCTAGSILPDSLSTVVWPGGEGCQLQAGADGMEMGCPAPREGGSVCLLPLLRACPQPPRWLGVALDAHGSCHLPPAPSSPGSAPERVTRPWDRPSPRHRDWRAHPCPSWAAQEGWIRALLLQAQHEVPPIGPQNPCRFST